jgi:hypothetical protein
MIASPPELEVKPPTIFSPLMVLAVSFWGLVLVIPVIISMLVVSVLQFGFLTFLIPLVTIGTATFFLPLGFGNPYVARLVRPLEPSSNQSQDRYLVQLTRKPRNRSGFLAILEDADDIGFLSLTDSDLFFHGDSIRLKVPYERVENLRLQNAGWRALFAYGPRTTFTIAGRPDTGTFTFAERASWHLPGSRKNARQMYQSLAQKLQGLGREMPQ